MRLSVFFLTLVLFFCVTRAQGDPDDPDDNDPGWPDDPPDDDPPPWRPTPTRRPTPPSKPSSLPTSSPTDDPDDPPAPIFTGVDTFDNATVYQPDDSTHHLTSPRTENLPNNTILAVWNDSAQTQDMLQVYQSTNNGFSWYAHGTAKPDVAGRRLLEPHILFAPALGDNTNITLLAVNAVDAKSTNIEVYVSSDMGVTFDFVHRVAEGGPMGAKAVGEPHLVVDDNRLTVYYSDRRDSSHAEKVSQQSTADIYGSWGSVINVVASQVSTYMNGKPNVARLPNSQYIIMFESSSKSINSTVSHAVNFKVMASPENAGTEAIRSITTASGSKPQGTPSVTWSSIGGVNGTIVVSDSTTSSLFVNSALGEGLWKEVPTRAGRSYGREVHSVPDKRAIRISGGAESTQGSSDILVTYIDFEKALAAAV